MSGNEQIEGFARFSAARELSGLGTDERYLDWERSEIITIGTATQHASEPVSMPRAKVVRKRPNQFQVQTDIASICFQSVVFSGCEFLDYTPSQVYRIAAADVSSFAHLTFKPSTASSFLSIVGAAPEGIGMLPTEFGGQISLPLHYSIDTLVPGKATVQSARDAEIRAAIESARALGLEEVASRLEELEALPVYDDEEPLRTGSVRGFVHFCAARRIKSQPLITASSSGEIDATWGGPDNDVMALRFFSDSTVHGYWRKGTASGTFAALWSDLLSTTFFVRLPEWV